MILKVQPGQNLMDLAIQCYGSADALFELANDNDLAMDETVLPGQALQIRGTLPASAIEVFANYITESGIIVASEGGPLQITVLATNDDEVLTDSNYKGLQI